MKTRSALRTKLNTQSETVMNAARRFMKTAVRLFAPYVQPAVLGELLAEEAVAYALHHGELKGQRKHPTLTEIRLVTGFSYSQVKGLMKQPAGTKDYYTCREAAILDAWFKDTRWRDPRTSQVADLPIHGPDGSFQSLVWRCVGQGVSTQAVVERLVAAGNVVVVNKLYVRLVNPYWRVVEDTEHELLDHCSRSITALTTCMENNIKCRNKPERKWPERRVYGSVDPEQVTFAQQQVSALILKQKDEMLALLTKLESKENTGAEIILGVGYYGWHDKCSDDDYIGIREQS